MQFDDGSSDIAPGHDISIDGQGGSQDLGAATYDSDHDGVADSVIVGQGDHTYVVTDADHDGHADSISEYDSHGTEVNSSSDGSGDQSTGIGSTSQDTGHDSTAGTGTDHTATDAGTDHSGTDAGTDHSGTDTTGTDTTGTDAGTDGGQDQGITVTGDDGAAHSVGEPTVDMDKDGTPDTAVVHNEDGSVTGYTDRDGDGSADQITQIGADGKVVIAVSDGHGGWEVAARGHIDSSGALVQDAGTGTTGTDQGTTDHTSTDHTTTGTDHGTTGTTGTDQGTDHTAPAGDISVTVDGQAHDLGKPTADMDGDGTKDTVVSKGSDGTVFGYTDTDGDGQVDQVTEVTADGHVVVAGSDGHGGWAQVATGHVDSSGHIVQDSGTSGTANGSADNGSTDHTVTDQQGNQTGQQGSTDHAGSDTGTHGSTESAGQAGDISVTVDGQAHDLGKPTADMDGDGTPDTVVSHQSDGTVVGYTDTDGDGQADQITEISPSGQVVIGASDGHGGWEQVASGHIDSDGQFVADSETSGGSSGSGGSGAEPVGSSAGSSAGH